MDYSQRTYNIDEHNPDPRDKRLLQAFLLGALSLAGLAAYVNLRPAPPHPVSGYIVGKEWVRPHMSDKEPLRVQEAGLPSTEISLGAHAPTLIPSQFTIWVANRENLTTVQVDSAQWFALRCGQRYTYFYRPGWL